MSISTLAELFVEASRFDKNDCFLHRHQGAYRPISTADFVRDVQKLAASLADMGVSRGDRVALLAANGPHWHGIDFASLILGAALVPIDALLPPSDVDFILNDSEAKVLFVQGSDRFEAILDRKEKLQRLQRILLIQAGEESETTDTYEEILRTTPVSTPDELERMVATVKPSDLATISYTSGTTAKPKGVMLTHANIVFTIQRASKIMELDRHMVVLAVLPLCFIFERVQDYCYLYKGCTIAYAQSAFTFAQDVQDVRPHVFVTAPRMFEKIFETIQQNSAKASSVKQMIFRWSVDMGRRSIPFKVRRQKLPWGLRWRLALADRLVFQRIRSIFGGRLRYSMVGGAPMAMDALEFFWGADVVIFEGYGLTETSPTVAVNRWGGIKLGTVGLAFPDIEVTLSKEREILVRGPNIMQGYLETSNREIKRTIDSDGWLHTGDIGEIDDEGFIQILGRKSHVLANAYGRKIVPEPLETLLKRRPFIAEAVLVGEGRPFFGALLVPDFEVLAHHLGKALDKADERAAVLASEEVQALFADEIERFNQRPEGYDKILGWKLLADEFTVASGELTPTQKVKRRKINTKYQELIASIYDEADVSI